MIRTRMTARDVGEQHRASSALELLFDLTFVVAIASIVVQLAHAIAENHLLDSLFPFFAIFFAIWWAWNQFTWLASAYDTDDVLYRVFTMVQMGGVLVLAAGVPAAFERLDLGAITLGYLIMRLGLLANLARAYHDDPASRGVVGRYMVGIAIVEAGWILRMLLIPTAAVAPAFIVLAAAELAVGPWATRAGDLAWHPRHIAERYGLFTIILLGESVLAVTLAVQAAIVDGVSVPLVTVAVSGLALLFTLWWLYFSEPSAEGLARRRERSYLWGYGHYVLFACLAMIGAGLEVSVEAAAHHLEAPDVVIGYALAVPLAVFIVLLWALNAPMVRRVSIPAWASFAAAALVLLVPLASPVIGVPGMTAASTLVAVALLVVALFDANRERAVERT